MAPKRTLWCFLTSARHPQRQERQEISQVDCIPSPTLSNICSNILQLVEIVAVIEELEAAAAKDDEGVLAPAIDVTRQIEATSIYVRDKDSSLTLIAPSSSFKTEGQTIFLLLFFFLRFFIFHDEDATVSMQVYLHLNNP